MISAEPSREYKRDLRQLRTWVGAGIAAFGALLLAIIAYAAWSSNDSAAEREHLLVSNAINRAITRTLNDLKSVAWWDDSVTNITDRHINTSFVDVNMGQFLTDTYAHDEVYVLNAQGHPVYAFFDNQRQLPSSFASRAADIAPVLTELDTGHSRLTQRPGVFTQGEYRMLAGGGRAARWSGHIISIGGRPAIVGAMTIVPNVDMSLTPAHPHVLLSVTYIDADFLAGVGQQLLLPDLARAPAGARGTRQVSQAFVTDDGVHLGELAWTTKHPGQVLLLVILPLAAVGIFLAGAFSLYMLRRLRHATESLADRESKTRHEAQHDALSGLPNRSYFLERLDDALAKRGAGLVGVAYVDLDRFKDINDTLGHELGDELLKSVAQRLRAHLRTDHVLSRFGGDEFAVLMTDGADDMAALGRAIRVALVDPFNEHGAPIRVTASVGVALAPLHGETTEALMRNADIALYVAKARGRDCTVLFDIEMAHAVETRRALEVDLREAAAAHMIEVVYQPIFGAHAEAPIAVEALARWAHPTRGDIEPDVFVPIAEDMGLMPSLGAQVLRRAFIEAAQWPELGVAVNLTRSQFRDPALDEMLARFAHETGIAPERVTLEISENVLIDQGAQTQERIDALRHMGFRVALDDFGAGYSSLAHLCNFKLDEIKIDASFVRGAARRESARAIVHAVVTLGRGLGMDIVAEGVETQADAVAMRHVGCTALQGFCLARPMPAAAISALLAQEKKTIEARAAAGE